MMHSSVAIVILNWNGRRYLEDFLPYLVLSTYANYSIIVADNGSTDDSVLFLKDRYPDIDIIRLDKNYGFATGYNLALRQVQADYYLLLNSDVQVRPNWIEPMVALLEKNLEIAACQPKVLSYGQSEYFEYAGAAGGWIDHFGYPFARGRVFDVSEKDTGQYDEEVPVFWATGAALFIRSAVFHEAGGFDNYFFAHQEEIDLCWRIQLLGYQIYSCPASVVYHVGGGTLPKGNSLKTYLNFRNNNIMIYKNMRGIRRPYVLMIRALLDFVSAVKSLFKGDGGYFVAVFSAHLSFMKWMVWDRKKSVFPKKKSASLQGYLQKNIAWEHFVKGKTKWSEIVEENGSKK
ncbi:glycosyltransferase family 2 protein [Niabella insulamsoli]|uniref:glycosyltransferase family 2 protein n=1 Tax=Niabella insulamsoli TaxID=3144874 RepID=UPI0031FD69F1